MRNKSGLNFKPESVSGLISCIGFGIEMLMVLICIIYSAFCGGEAGVIIGIVSVVVFFLGLIGMGIAIHGLHKKEQHHRLSRIGLLLNILMVVIMITIYCVGMVALL